MRSGVFRVILAASLVPLLVACENSATAYAIDSKEHALTLIRERQFFWSDTVDQSVVVARLPACQRKVAIHPGTVALTAMEVFEAGDRLWALRQGNRWYLASTEECLVQDWDNPTGQPPGPFVGSFSLRDGEPAFVTATD